MTERLSDKQLEELESGCPPGSRLKALLSEVRKARKLEPFVQHASDCHVTDWLTGGNCHDEKCNDHRKPDCDCGLASALEG